MSTVERSSRSVTGDGPAGQPASDAVRTMDSLRRIVRALRVATRASERAFGISAAQLFILRQLALAPGQSLRDLADRTRTTQSTISEVVARLVRRGLVSRTPSAHDRRRAELQLTAAGRTVLEAAPETVQERLLRGFEQLHAATRRAIANDLEAWLAAAGLDDVSPTLFFEQDSARTSRAPRPRQAREVATKRVR